MRLTYHIAVQREVDDACAWYDERKDHLGDEFFQEFERVLASIAANPQAFPQSSRGRRKAHLKRFPTASSIAFISKRAHPEQPT